ncbi:MAG: cobaltochelatase subunit CobN [Synergistaceae bacterium]|nr:cobaltochelatase subunit CobN [Synergistaceae bacterium]
MKKIFLFAIAFFSMFVLTPAACWAADVSLIVIDSDSFVAQEAMANLDLPQDIRARAYCLADLESAEAEEFVRGSEVILVDVMGWNLAQYLLSHGLTEGKTVFALRRSRDDKELRERGFLFDSEVAAYFLNIGRENIRNMLKLAIHKTLDGDVSYGPVEETLKTGLYHPDAPSPFGNYVDYMRWSESRSAYNAELPRLGITVFSTSVLEGQRDALDELVSKLEGEGFNVIVAFGPDRVTFESFFLDEKRRPRVDAVLLFTLKFYSALDEELGKLIEALDTLVFNAINIRSLTIDEWSRSEQGLPVLDVTRTLATPEISGIVEPTPLMAKVEERHPSSGGVVYRTVLIPGMVERMAPRIHNWIKLRKKPNSEKKVAILYYNNSQGKQKIGASYLNVFRSLEEISSALQNAGYLVSNAALREENIQGLVLRGGRNVGSWAPGELEALIASGQAELLPVETYKKWFAELPEDFKRRVTEQWGEPGRDGPMIKDGNIVIPMVSSRNLVMLPEPPRAVTDDPMKLYHDAVIYPHHQYIAVYLWLERVFGADAMVHLGTHATHEWLPGKQSGLSLSCPPEVMVTDVPNLYPYNMDLVGEGLQAKRRGRAVTLDHLTPTLTPAEGYAEYKELKEFCAQYESAASTGSLTEETYLERVRALAESLGLHKDLGLEEIGGEEDVEALAEYLEYLETDTAPYGLHTYGRSPAEDEVKEFAASIVRQNVDWSAKAAADNLSRSGPSEMTNFLRALEGRYVPPAEAGDPIRNPGALPTGKNFYGIFPNRLPTPAAWELGQKAAEQIVSAYTDKHGTYPDKVAVVLWAEESLRNEGLNEATLFALIGVEPVWNASGTVTGTRPIPGSILKRPRIDVLINPSSLYRDIFPDKLLFIDNAIRQAVVQDDIENFIARNDLRIKERLMTSGMSEEEAVRFSKVRIFSARPGSYGTRVSEMVSASGLWKEDSAVSDVYRKQIGFAYGEGLWGEPAQGAFDENMRDSKVAWHSVSSNLYGLLDNDDMFQWLGGLSMAIRHVSGVAPDTLVADQRTRGLVKMKTLQKFLAGETRARYLNPRWIEGMKEEKYAGAAEMSDYVDHLWGWQVTTPEAVDDSLWKQTYEVYVTDKYGLDIHKFLDENNPWAYQSMTARMLETARRGYWDAGEEIERKLAVNYAMSVINRGVACCDHTCNNPQFHQTVLNIISIPGLMAPEMTAEFKLAVEKTGQKSLEEMVEARANLLKNLGEATPSNSAAGPESDTGEVSVKGFKMERVEDRQDHTSLSSSGVEWFAAAFVLALLALFYAGLRRGKKKD